MTTQSPEVRVALDELAKRPLDDKAFERAWSALVGAEQYTTLILVTERAAQRKRSADLYARAGDAAMTYLRDQDRAVSCYERALVVDPKQPKALKGARTIYLRQRRYWRAGRLVVRELALGGSAQILSEFVNANGDDTDLSKKNDG